LSFFPTPEKRKTPKPATQSRLREEPIPTQWTQATLFGQPDRPSERQTAEGVDLLSDLNPQQRQAVLCTDVPLIIVAGPGTGKTRTLTHRIAYLITAKGVAPEHILAITFTNKAAEEMANRLTHLLGEDVSRRIVIRTFHAFGVMLLREAGKHIDLTADFAIVSEADRHALLKQLHPDLSERELHQHLDDISAAKNQLLAPDLVDAPLAEVYRDYQQALVQDQLLDFDDLIFKSVQLFESQADVLKAYKQRFRWISVDEYQDINYAQYRLLQLLTGPENNLCVIGDPDQAIYGFRGANRAYFLQFDQDFPTARTFQLSQNYRSTQLILDASGQVIEKSPSSERVKIWSNFVDRTKIEVYRAPTDRAEAEYVVHEIEKMMGGLSYFSIDSERVTDDDGLPSRSFTDFAVLYRLRAQNPFLIEAFQRSGIPYQTFGQTPLAEYQDARIILASLWFLHNPGSTFFLKQVAPNKQVQSTVSFLNGLSDVVPEPVSVLIEKIYQFFADQSIIHFDEKSNERIQQLRLRAIPFENHLGEFLESMALQKETDLYDPRADRVTMMTLHAAKGLEFPVVFIVGCEEDLLPHKRGHKRSDIDEERRLFYVGMTRAQQKLILTHARTRFLFGQTVESTPSRFLEDIENALKEVRKMAPRKPPKKEQDDLQLKLF
jgi:DNA helicase-2/ATP-dependent DNA helicase PcrA